MSTIHELRKEAHNLKPIVIVGSKGLSASVLQEIDRALFDHELIKIKLAAKDREAKKEQITQICTHAQADLVQTIGHTITIYRERIE